MVKYYTRLKNVELTTLYPKKDIFHKLLLHRSSYRIFSRIPLAKKSLSEILFYAAGITHVSPKGELYRSHPSAGAKFPIEIYPLVLVCNDLPSGLYHYNPETHSLTTLLEHLSNEDLENVWLSQKWFKKASVILIMTGVFRRTTETYGLKGLPFLFIEAGHIGQNIYLLAESLGIGCCSIGQVNEKELARLLDIHVRDEAFIYGLALGN